MTNALEELLAYATPIAKPVKHRGWGTASEFVADQIRKNIQVLEGKATYERLPKFYHIGEKGASIEISYKNKLMPISPGKPWLPCKSNSKEHVIEALTMVLKAVEEGHYAEQLDAIRSATSNKKGI